MQETMFIKPNDVDATALNNLLYPLFVTADGINFIYPFQAGTEYYLKPGLVYVVNEDMIQATTDPRLNGQQQAFVYEQCVTLAKNRQEAEQAGWFDEPISD